MEKKYLVVNLGSVSKRYAIYREGEEILSKHFEKDEMNPNDFEVAIEKFVDMAIESGVMKNNTDINGIGVRVVASGSFFRENKLIDEIYIDNLKKAEEKAPLHLKPLIDELERFDKTFPNIPIAGISDSAFHSTLPAHSFVYNIPQEDAKNADIYRFGYHGISMQSVLRKIQEKEALPAGRQGSVPARIIVAHLGGGASITAIKDGKSFDTSMGATPLEGLPMSTRVGNIGAGALIQIAKSKNIDLDQLNEYLNTQCGLFGISGKTGNIKELIDLEARGDKNALLSLQVFVYNIKKYIGAYIAAMNGLDMIVLSGTVSERSPIMREKVLEGLEYFGIEIDKNKNDSTLNVDGYIESTDSKIKIEVIKIDELREIALKTSELLK